jgi:hypothetical protein
MTVASKRSHTTSFRWYGRRWYEVVCPLYYCTIPPYHLKREKAFYRRCCVLATNRRTQQNPTTSFALISGMRWYGLILL